MREHLAQKSGFSLVELSIVLVILGLLTGGILAGQSLIRAAEIRKQISTIEQFQSAYMTFKGKYFAMPGDMNNARDFWPDGTCGDLEAVCNGTGDGVFTNATESRQSWLHLTKAQLWPGNFTGWYRTTGIVNNYDFPASPLGSHLGMDFVRKQEGVGSAFHNHIKTGHYLHVGSIPSDSVGNGYLQENNVITADELWRIDKKLDDGLPLTGIVATSTRCTTGSNNAYDLDDQDEDRCYFWTKIDN